MKKILLATTLSALLVACGGNEHGPSYGSGSGGTGGNGGTGGEPVKPKPEDSNVIIGERGTNAILAQTIKDAKAGKEVGLILTVGKEKVPVTVNFDDVMNINKGAVFVEDKYSFQMVGVTGDKSFMTLTRHKDSSSGAYGGWVAIGAHANDITHVIPEKGTQGILKYEGEVIGIGDPSLNVGNMAKGNVLVHFNTEDYVIEGLITGKGDRNGEAAFGKEGLIFGGDITNDNAWTGKIVDVDEFRKGSATSIGDISGNFWGNNAEETSGSYEFIHDVLDKDGKVIDTIYGKTGGFVAGKVK